MKKLVAVITSACFIFSIVSGTVYAGYERSGSYSLKSEKFSEPAIAGSAGKITGGAFFGGSRVVINIQDLHCNPEVQKNIASVLADLDKKYGMESVFAEGASSDISTEWICSVANEQAKKEILEALLASGRLTGSEYYSAVAGRPDLIKGIENKKVHGENIIRLGKILGSREKYGEITRKLDKELFLIQAKYLNSANNNFNKTVQDYRNGKINSFEYYSGLAKSVKKINAEYGAESPLYHIDFKDYPNLLRHMELMGLAGKLNYNKVSSQLSAFVQEIKEKMPYSVFVELSAKTNKFASLHDLYVYIPQIVMEYDIKVDDKYPELKTFLEYTRKEKEFNPLSMLREERLLCEKIRMGLSEDINETEVSFLSDFYLYFKDYIAASITPDDYKYFSLKINEFKDTWNKYVYDSAINDISGDFAMLDEYYRANLRRDSIFSGKLSLSPSGSKSAGTNVFALGQQEIKDVLANSDITVVITGGFHSEALADKLKELKISYITITPNVSGYFNSSALYEEMVKNQTKLFSGQALAPALGSANAKITFENNKAFIDFNGEKLELDVNETNGKYELKIISSQHSSKKALFLTREAVRQTAENMNRLRSFANPLESANIVFALVEEAAKAGVERGFISGNGLIWAIAGNEALVNALKESGKETALNEIAMLPDMIQMYIAGSAVSEIKTKYINNPVLKALADIPEFGSFVREFGTDKTKTPKLEKLKLGFSRALKAAASNIVKKVLLIVLITAVAMIPSLLPAKTPSNMPQQTAISTQIQTQNNELIRSQASIFMQGNKLPRSFVEPSVQIADPDQKMISEQGVIIYDMAVLMKALLLYPQENRDLIEGMVNALAEGQSVKSNKDFDYGNPSVNNNGYFWKILDVDAKWLQNQSVPVTGENAWIAGVMANVAETYKGSALGDRAQGILTSLSEAMLALQLDNGLIRMAPRDKVSDYSYTVNYYDIVSVENNISALPVLRYMAEKGPQANRAKYKAAYDKLESALIGMYNKEKGYFNSGLFISPNRLNTAFATDCQTWMILAVGPERFDLLMKEKYGISDASIQLLNKTLETAGVKKDGVYTGLDFTNRKTIVSFEWTFGFLSAAKQALAKTPDANLSAAVSSIEKYVNLQRNSDKTFDYTDSDEFISTGFGWIGIPAKSLASSAWSIYNNLNIPVSPFDFVVQAKDGSMTELFTGRKTGITAKPVTAKTEAVKKAQASSAAKSESVTASVTGSNYYGGENWANFAVFKGQGVKINAGDKIVLSYDNASPYNEENKLNFLMRVVTDNETIFFSNSDDIIKSAKYKIVKMEKGEGFFAATLPDGGIIEEVVCDFGNTTIYFTVNNIVKPINPDNKGNPRFKSVTIERTGQQAASANDIEQKSGLNTHDMPGRSIAASFGMFFLLPFGFMKRLGKRSGASQGRDKENIASEAEPGALAGSPEKRISDTGKNATLRQVYAAASKAIKGAFILIAALMMFACEPDEFIDSGTVAAEYQNEQLVDFDHISNDKSFRERLEKQGIDFDAVVAKDPYKIYFYYLDTKMASGDERANNMGWDMPFIISEDSREAYQIYSKYRELSDEQKASMQESVVKPVVLSPEEYAILQEANKEILKNREEAFKLAEEMRAIQKSISERENASKENTYSFIDAEDGPHKTAAKEWVLHNNKPSVVTDVNISGLTVYNDSTGKLSYTAEMSAALTEYVRIKKDDANWQMRIDFNLDPKVLKKGDYKIFVEMYNVGEEKARTVYESSYKDAQSKIGMVIPVEYWQDLNRNKRIGFRLYVADTNGQLLDSGDFKAENLGLSLSLQDEYGSEYENRALLKAAPLSFKSVRNDDISYTLFADKPLNFNKGNSVLISKDIATNITLDKVYNDSSVVLEVKNESSAFDNAANAIEVPLGSAQEQSFIIPWNTIKTLNQNEKIKIKVTLKTGDKEAKLNIISSGAETRSYESTTESVKKAAQGESNASAGLGMLVFFPLFVALGSWKDKLIAIFAGLPVIKRVMVFLGKSDASKAERFVNYHIMSAKQGGVSDEAFKIIEKFDAVAVGEDGKMYTNIYFAGMPSDPYGVSYENLGWTVDREYVWGSAVNGSLVIFSKAVPEKVVSEFDKIISGKGKARASASALSRLGSVSDILSESKNLDNLTPGIVIDHNENGNSGRYNENGSLVVSADILGESRAEILNKLTYMAEIRKVDANAVSKELDIHIKSTDADIVKAYLGAFAAMGNNRMILEYGFFKGLSEKQTVEILTLAKANGISVSVNVSGEDIAAFDKDHFRELGFAEYITTVDGKMYANDYFSQKVTEIFLKTGYKTESELLEMVRKNDKRSVVDIAELEAMFSVGTRSVADKVSMLGMFKSAILKLRSGRVLTAEYVRDAAYAWNTSSLPALPADMSNLLEAIKQNDLNLIMRELKLEKKNENALSIYMDQMANDIEDESKLKSLRIEFMKAVIEKSLAQKTLKDNGINDGLANSVFENLLGQKMLASLLGATAVRGVPAGVRSFIDGQQGTFKDLNAMIAAQSNINKPESINAVIELILLSEQKTKEIRVSKTAVTFDAKAVEALLKAA